MVATAGCGGPWCLFGMRNVTGTSICATTTMTMTRPRCIVVCIVVLRSCCCCYRHTVIFAITLYCCILLFAVLVFLFLLFLLLSVVCSHGLLLCRRHPLATNLPFLLLSRCIVVSRCFALLLFLLLSMWFLCSYHVIFCGPNIYIWYS